jgi:hypothetical protein
MLYFVFNSVGNLYDCGLRIRVTSERRNQTLFWETAKQIKNSQVVIKLQQDKIEQLLSSANSVKHDY